MNLPSFLWLWRIAAWSMGLTIAAYCVLAVSGLGLTSLDREIARRSSATDEGQAAEMMVESGALRSQLRILHLFCGVVIVGLVLLLLAIGVVGTLGHFGTLGHSLHLPVGLVVVGLTIAAAVTGLRIAVNRPNSRSQHRAIDLILFFALVLVVITGWDVVQKYLPGT